MKNPAMAEFLALAAMMVANLTVVCQIQEESR
jgi:hypothetical protein